MVGITFLFLHTFQPFSSGSFAAAAAATAATKSLQSCPTLCDPTDGSPPGSPRPWDSPGKNTGVGCHVLLQCMKVKSESEVVQSFSRVRLLAAPPADLPKPGTEPASPSLAGRYFTTER